MGVEQIIVLGLPVDRQGGGGRHPLLGRGQSLGAGHAGGGGAGVGPLVAGGDGGAQLRPVGAAGLWLRGSTARHNTNTANVKIQDYGVF